MTRLTAERRREGARPVTPTAEGSASAAGVLALMAVLGGSCTLAASRFPLGVRTPGALGVLLGALEVLGGFVLAIGRHHVGARGVYVAIGARVAITCALVVRVPAAAGVALVGLRCVSLAMFAAYFCSRRNARAVAGAAVVAYSAGVLIGRAEGFVLPWLVLVLSTLAGGETFGRLVDRLRQLAGRDGLTGLANRSAFRATAQREIALSERGRTPLSLILLDLDDFKNVNDVAGHLAGDTLLVELARAWETRLRGCDVLARLGGDEFAVLLPATTTDQAAFVVDRLHAAHPAPWSAGISTLTAGADLDDLLRSADQQLYDVKRQRTHQTT